jgi:hypothetical protein
MSKDNLQVNGVALRISKPATQKKRGWFRASQKEPSGGKPNRNHPCEEENDAAFGPVHFFSSVS